ncbi:MAG: hypothetical protein FWG44_00990 [Oscillospiraceae bacterium]|nr:hypothetical protein [Oscillospiraceae bacterium]
MKRFIAFLMATVLIFTTTATPSSACGRTVSTTDYQTVLWHDTPGGGWEEVPIPSTIYYSMNIGGMPHTGNLQLKKATHISSKQEPCPYYYLNNPPPGRDCTCRYRTIMVYQCTYEGMVNNYHHYT